MTTIGHIAITTGEGRTNPVGKYTRIPVNGAGPVVAFAEALDSIPPAPESWLSGHIFEGNRRGESAWRLSHVSMVDIDWHEPGAKKPTPPPPVVARLREAVDSGKVPGSIFHVTPHGARVFFVFAAPVEDAAAMRAIVKGAAQRVRDALEALELAERPGAAGYSVDTNALDLARFMYSPRSIVDGKPRVAEVIVMRREPYTAAELQPEHKAAPPPAPAPRPTSTRSTADGSETIDAAAARWNADHRLDLPRRGSGDCPACGGKGGFGELPEREQWWFCWHQTHPATVGRRSKNDRGYFGDALDLEAHARGISRVEVLRRDGYLSPICGDTNTRSNKPCGAAARYPDGKCVRHSTDATAREERRRYAQQRAQQDGLPAAALPRTEQAMPTAAVTDAASTPWPELRPLPEGLPSVPACDPGMLPEDFKGWVSDMTERMQSAPDYAAVGALVALSAVVGRSVGIRPKLRDGWTVVPNLWGAGVGKSGVMKSPTLEEAIKPVNRLAVRAGEAFEVKRKQAEFSAVVAKAKRKAFEKRLEKAVDRGEDPEALRVEVEAEEQAAPVLKRYILNDATVEKTGELLNENPRGLLYFRDELTGWFRTLDRDGHENDRAFYLEAWSGTGSYTYDRIARGHVHIPACCLSILGGIQPEPLRDYMVAAVKGGAGDDGLIQRFQLLVWPDMPTTWRYVDRLPDRGARDRAFEVFRRLDELDVRALGAEQDDFSPVPFLRFSNAAQEVFVAWLEETERRLRGDIHHALGSHQSKYRSLFPSLALLFHLIDWAGGRTSDARVGVDAAALAQLWCSFLWEHALRVYALVLDRGGQAAALLGDRIRQGKTGSPFKARDVARMQWSGLADLEAVTGALEVLEEYGWVRPEKVRSTAAGGRPTVRFHVHPELLKGGR